MITIKSDECIDAIIAIVDSSLEHKLLSVLSSVHPPNHLITHGYGMARSDIYEILGFGGPKKIISFSLQPRSLSNQILHELQNHIEFNRPGTGIAFTIQVSSISHYFSQLCGKTKADNPSKQEEYVMSSHPYYLIFAIVNRGNFEKVMEAARSAGATGGTLLHGRGLSSEEAVKFLGITIQPEKDIVLILAPQKDHHKIMERISHELSINSPGKGICFSLPVNSALGLGTMSEE